MNRETMNSETDDILGYTPAGLPIWPISGSEGDDDEDDTGTDTSGSGDADDPDDDAEDEWTPPTREEFERVTKALERANAEAKKRRLREKAKGNAKDGETDEDAATKAREEVEAAYRPRLIKAEARAALIAAGAPSDRVAKLLRLVDVDELELGDDGEVEGLDDAIEEIKADYPELFAAKEEQTNGRRVPRANGAGRQAASKPKSSAELLAGALAGRR